MSKLKSRFMLIIIISAFIGGSSCLFGQSSYKVDPQDVSSIDTIVKVVYECISGPKGTERDWDRFRALFLPGAKLTAVRLNREGERILATSTVEEFIERTSEFYKVRGFFEVEDHAIIEEFNHIGHSFSTYISRWDSVDAEPFGKGINSFQLYKDNGRWWIQSVFWEYETPEAPIPGKYLSN